jgi:hypothetical protein
MQCHQCPRPAFCTLRDKASDEVVSLCLPCWHQLQEANFRSFLLNAAMVNPSRLSKLPMAEERKSLFAITKDHQSQAGSAWPTPTASSAMSNVVHPSFPATSNEMAERLIKAGYLQPALRHDSKRMKQDLMGQANEGPTGGLVRVSQGRRAPMRDAPGAAGQAARRR